MTMRRLTRREQIYTFLFTIFLVVYCGYNYLVKPLQDKIESLDTAIEAQKRQISKNFRLIRKAEALGRESEGLIQQFKQKRTNEQEMSAILSEIEEVSRGAKLQISDLKPKQVQKQDYYNRFVVSLSIDSEFADIIQFLNTLQAPPHYYEVEEVNFEQITQNTPTTVRTTLVLVKILIP